jgi:hypothetical protein
MFHMIYNCNTNSKSDFEYSLRFYNKKFNINEYKQFSAMYHIWKHSPYRRFYFDTILYIQNPIILLILITILYSGESKLKTDINLINTLASDIS